MSKKSNIFKYAPILLAATLAACGGGGSSDSNGEGGNAQMSNSVSPGGVVEVEFGKTIALSSMVNVLRSSVTGHAWTVTQTSGDPVVAANAPKVIDASCTSATKRPGAAATPSSVGTTGSSNCRTSLIVPSTASVGEWIVKNTAVSTDSNSATASFVLKVKAPAPSANGLVLLVPNAPQIQDVNSIVRLVSAYRVASGVKVDSVEYTWTKVSGPGEINLVGTNTATPSFYATQLGEYVFNVVAKVTINGQVEKVEGTIVLVVGTPEVQTNFQIDAGTAKVVKIDDVVQLTGSVTGNTPVETLSYEWSQVSGPAQPVLGNANTLTPSFIPKVSGTYVFQLKVTSPKGFKTTTTTVAVGEAVSTVPVFAVSAGDAQTQPLGVTVLLKGTVTNGTPAPTDIVYSWTQLAGPVVPLANAKTANASFVLAEAGTYEFVLSASSGGVVHTANTVVVGVAPVVVEPPTTPTNPQEPVFSPGV